MADTFTERNSWHSEVKMSATKEKILNTVHRGLTVKKIIAKYANKHIHGLEFLIRKYQSLSIHTFPCILWNLNIYWFVHKSSTMHSNLSQSNLTQNFIISLQARPMFPISCHPFIFLKINTSILKFIIFLMDFYLSYARILWGGECWISFASLHSAVICATPFAGKWHYASHYWSHRRNIMDVTFIHYCGNRIFHKWVLYWKMAFIRGLNNQLNRAEFLFKICLPTSKTFLRLYETRWFITVFIKVFYWSLSWTRWIYLISS
jgi:hypothetical protein